MRRCAPIVCACAAVALLQSVHAQTPASQARRVAPPTAATLPVRRVVLYKNGVGYFEHVGRVIGNQSVSIQFNSAQLNDALKSMTVLDLGNGRVGNISFNSDAPLATRLGELPLPAGPGTTLADLLAAMRGARLDVTSGGRTIVGRLLSIERHVQVKNDSPPIDRLTIVTDAGEIRTVDLTPSVGIKLAERESNAQVSTYLGLLASARAQDRRRMTISTAGAGTRDLLVGYISAVPVWKTTYRIVLPSGEDSKPLLQGWAIVDNTVGEDWDGVQLSLVAGAPQSFVQALSQPQYMQRPVVAMPHGGQPAPQLHLEGAASERNGLNGRVVDQTGAVLPGVTVNALENGGRRLSTVTDAQGQYAFAAAKGTYRLEFVLSGFQTRIDRVDFDGVRQRVADVTMRVAALAESMTITANSPVRVGGIEGGVVGGATGGGRFDRVAIEEGLANMQTAAQGENLGDLFEYRLSAPITIHRNESALVPILSAAIGVDRVSLWNEHSGVRPLRALWLTNSTGLTLDGGSFAVLDEATFAGEGLLEPIKPGEKRLLSYGVDLGVQVESRLGDSKQEIARVRINRGVAIQEREDQTRKVYTIRNSDASARTVIVEHPTRAGWTLVKGSSQPVETSLTSYRFLVPVAAKGVATLTVDEFRPIETRYAISQLTDDQIAVFVREARANIRLTQALEPIQAKKSAVAALSAEISARADETTQIATDQTRLRGNMEALKGSSGEQQLRKRYIAALNQQEDRIATLRRETADLAQTLSRAQADLTQLLEALSLDIEVR
ncbi:MAG TPA: carboxypeptidase regulatory-like domain-containing protein [Vicinamibacterales bacterium]